MSSIDRQSALCHDVAVAVEAMHVATIDLDDAAILVSCDGHRTRRGLHMAVAAIRPSLRAFPDQGAGASQTVAAR